MNVKEIDKDIVKMFHRHGDVIYPDSFLTEMDYEEDEIQNRLIQHIEKGHIGYTNNHRIDCRAGNGTNIYEFVH